MAKGHSESGKGAKPKVDRVLHNLPAGGLYSNLTDMLQFASELTSASTGIGVVAQSTLTQMYEPHTLLGGRVPFQGLCFFLDEESGHRVVSHNGDFPGYEAALVIAPDDQVAVVALCNTKARGAAVLVSRRLLRSALGLEDQVVVGRAAKDLPSERVPEIAGVYRAPRGSRNLRLLALTGGVLRVEFSGGALTMRGRLGPWRRTPVVLHPYDPSDELRFRVMLTGFPYEGIPLDVVFSAASDNGDATVELGLVGAKLHRSRK